MNKFNLGEVLENCHDIESQKKFLNHRVNELKQQMLNTGDFGRTELVNMFIQILVSLDNNINESSFTAELIRKTSEWRLVCRKYESLLSNNQRKLANLELFKLKKLGKELDLLVSVKLGQLEDKK